MHKIPAFLYAVLAATALLCSCASQTSTPAPEPSAPTASTEPTAVSAQASGNQTFFAEIKEKMTPEQVMALIGAPGNISSGQSGKQWIPFYFGADTGRVYWSYKGIGVVVFSQNSHNGNLAVMATRYDDAAP
jgi:hypothetical protein